MPLPPRLRRRLGSALAALAASTLLLAGLPAGAPVAAAASGAAPAPALQPPLYNPLAAQRWFYGQRAGAGGAIPAGAYAAARRQAAALPQTAPAPTGSGDPPAAGAAGTAGATGWQSLGPSPVTGDYFAQGSVSGRVDGIAVASNGTIYLATAGGGVWSSTDGGAQWTPLTDSQPSLAIGAIAVAPHHPDIVYAGTGEDHNAVDSFYGAGVLKSTDGGATWSVLGGNLFSGDHISSVVVVPGSDGQHVYVAGSMGVDQSTDGGLQWTALLQPQADVSALVLDPSNPSVLYAAINSLGVYETTDGGASWTALGGLPTGATFGNTALAIAPSNPSVLYASVANGQFGGSYGALVGLYVSTDGGGTWATVPGAPDYLAPASFYGSAYANVPAQGWYDNTLAVSPTDPGTVIAGGIALEEVSAATGSTPSWTEVLPLHPDQHALTFAPGGTLYIGNDGGVWTLPPGASPSGGTVDLNTNLGITQQYPGLSEYGNGAQVLAGAQDNGTALYTGAPAWSQVFGGDGMMTAIDPANPQTMYTEAGNGYLVRSTDGGSNWTRIEPPVTATPAWVAPLALAAANPALDQSGAGVPALHALYFGSDNLWGSAYRGASWTRLTDTGGRYGSVSAIAVAPSNPQVLYVGWSSGHVALSADGGRTWTAISPGPGRFVTDIAVSPSNPYAAYVTLSGFAFPQSTAAPPHLLYTPDASAALPAWGNLTGNLPDAPVNAVVLDGSSLIVGTDVGVFTSADGGQAWSSLGTGLPNVQVMSLLLSAHGTLLAATHGRGAWSIAVGAPPQAPTAVTGLSLSAGPPAGGTPVTISGSGLEGATQVLFGLVPAASFTVVSANEIAAVSPPGGGTVDVTVAAPGGLSASVAGDRFTYTGTPDLAALAPPAEPAGSTLTLSGTGFGAPSVGDAVYFTSAYTGSVQDFDPTSWSATQIQLPMLGSPYLLPGGVTVAVYAPQTGMSDALPMTLTGGPSLNALSVPEGPAGTALTLAGAGFGTAAVGTAVYFSQPGTLLPVRVAHPSDTQVAAVVPAGLLAGPVSVAVYNPAVGYSNALPFTLVGPLQITTTTLPQATEGAAYTATLGASGGTAPYTWSAAGLPPGLTLNAATGGITGAPTEAGSFPLSVSVSDAEQPAQTATARLTLTVAVAPLEVTTTTLPAGTVGAAYTATLAASGGTTPYTWSAAGLPAGLALDAATGAISGTPSAAGTFLLAVTVSGGAPGEGATASLALVVAPGAAPPGGGGGLPGGGSAGGGGGGGGGGSGGGGVNTPTDQTPTTVTEVVDAGAGPVTVATSDDAFRLVIPAAGLPANTTLAIRQVPAQGEPALPAGTALASPIWAIDSGGVQPSLPAGLDLRYSLPAGVSPLQLGLYTLVGGRWALFSPGRLHTASGTLVAVLPHFSTWAVLAETTRYPDVPSGFWAFRAISTLTAAHVVAGFPDGLFRPQAAVTRAQFLKLILAAAGVAPRVGQTQPFSDVRASAWYAGYVDVAAAQGLLLGSGGLARPEQPISRQEAAVILMRTVNARHLAPAVGTQPAESPAFRDGRAIAVWARTAVAEAVRLGLVQGFPDGTFGPLQTLTRAQAAELAAQVLRLRQAGTPAAPPA